MLIEGNILQIFLTMDGANRFIGVYMNPDEPRSMPDLNKASTRGATA